MIQMLADTSLKTIVHPTSLALEDFVVLSVYFLVAFWAAYGRVRYGEISAATLTYLGDLASTLVGLGNALDNTHSHGLTHVTDSETTKRGVISLQILSASKSSCRH